ncbi:hypothetical protein E8P82_14235 [Arthrobacter echini]|uniref:Pycsar effector protein domain-containing protein n=1 Tax=Arthrobacter echini TaxID=1529066 RepID=A0A4S5E0B7_9MICC|nr:hypothetical protein [Arthrobacter echini]THJ64727.1 hypothetical protein E8P82_14235 [Arthrobacter echini]
MSWLRAKADTKAIGSEQAEPGGAVIAMEHVANWVRFADTKATILSAGVAAILVMAVSHTKTVIAGAGTTPQGITVITLAAVSVAALLWTLFWIIRAIRPSRETGTLDPNRYAWPAMSRLPLLDLQHHVRTITGDEDAWRQTHDLAKMADSKFTACRKATTGFAALILATPACIITALISTAG